MMKTKLILDKLELLEYEKTAYFICTKPILIKYQM